MKGKAVWRCILSPAQTALQHLPNNLHGSTRTPQIRAGKKEFYYTNLTSFYFLSIIIVGILNSHYKAYRAYSFELSFFDSFESSANWTANWSQDAQNDCRRRTARSYDASYSAEVDGRATDAQLISRNINLQGKTNATITFWWFIESGLDTGEYLAFDVSAENGENWTEKASLNGNVDPENTWHYVETNLTGINNLRIRFKGRISSSREDAYVDVVKVVAWECPVLDWSRKFCENIDFSVKQRAAKGQPFYTQRYCSNHARQTTNRKR